MAEMNYWFMIYDIDRNEKIGEAYDVYMCQDMLYLFWSHGIDNIQIQRIDEPINVIDEDEGE